MLATALRQQELFAVEPQRTRPFLKWAGGKFRVLNKILPLLPAGDRLVEPFAGSAAVSLNAGYGDRPDVDFIVKFLEPGAKSRLRTPTNLHWVVDLLLKAETNKGVVSSLVDYYIDFYSQAKAFETPDDRDNYQPVTPSMILDRFPALDHKGTYSLDYICHVIELFTICEKATPRDKKMFWSLLECLRLYFKGERDFYQVLNAAAPGYR